MFLVMAEVVLETLISAASLPSDDEIFGRTLRGLWVVYMIFNICLLYNAVSGLLSDMHAF